MVCYVQQMLHMWREGAVCDGGTRWTQATLMRRIQRIREGRTALLVQAKAPFMVFLARHRGNRAEAEDLLQTAYLCREPHHPLTGWHCRASRCRDDRDV
jgi:hypothetical protein